MKSCKLFIFIFLVGSILLSILACDDYLTVKPNKKLVSPSSAEDYKAMMNNVNLMNYSNISGLGETASDNLYIKEENWNAMIGIVEEAILPYIWGKVPIPPNYWNSIYRAILQTNVVIDGIDNVSFSSIGERNEVLGAAYFFRGYAFFELSQIYSVPYDAIKAKDDLGIVLRLSPDINEVSKRSNLQESYDQIISDLQMAARLLSTQKSLYPTRPYKASAYAALARCYITMREYENAWNYADSTLMIHDNLLDYNSVKEQEFPFDRFNDEVILYSHTNGGVLMTEANLRVDTNLINQYSSEDRRRALYFKKLSDGYYGFVGDYSQSPGTGFFNGLTTAEVLLIRAECAYRLGKRDAALSDLIKFMDHRYVTVHSNKLENSQDNLLNIILSERRKELVFRGARWSDLRRLNMEEPVKVEKRIGNTVHILKSDDIKRFAFYIPITVIERSQIEQNR